MNKYGKYREVGDAYTYLAYKRDSQFLICFTVGKWNDYTCDEFYESLAKRVRFPTRKRRITIYSDGNKQNLTGILKHFPKGSVNYGVRKKIRDKDGNVVGIVSKVVFGKNDKVNIAINNIDSFCSKLRERVSCFTRKARSFAKRKACIETRLEILGTQHNWIEKKKGQTPAMKEGLQSKPLNWSLLLHKRLSYTI